MTQTAAPATNIDLAGFPEWARQLYTWLPACPQMVLAGNVADLHLAPAAGGATAPRATADVVADCLRASGYDVVLRWNVVLGLMPLYERENGAAASAVGADLWSHRAELPPLAGYLTELLQSIVNNRRLRIGLIVESAPRLAPGPDDPDLHRLYATAQHLSQTVARHRLPSDTRQGLYNTVIWTIEREADLPHWLIGAEGMRVISVPTPTMGTRHAAAQLLVRALPGYGRLDDVRAKATVAQFSSTTEGMSLLELAAAVPMAIDGDIPAQRVEDSVRLLRSGVRSSPWREPAVRAAIRNATATLNERVLGQERAIGKVVDVLARAALGLSGAQASGHPTRPQGVLFLAGPTGVGKTELAKQIATAVFGREEAMQRFDMSEFAAEHTEARLLGAPPGYTGHDAGGELTNAVRRRPFCLLLFDEIEKAHPRILDKFLQILEDGRLTDSSGNTVHFTETLIVFTSNLGIYREREGGPPEPVVKPGDRYETVESTVREAIRNKFLAMGRPELLNRIGDNIVVFDFITADAASKLLRRSLRHSAEEVYRNTGSQISFADAYVRQLDEIVRSPQALAYGGRAVLTTVESRLLNPLARPLLDSGDQPGRFQITSLRKDEAGVHLELDRLR